jgi:Icc protein
MIIAHLSDSHIALDVPDADQRLADLDATVAAINGLVPSPDVIVHTGDIVHNGRADEYAHAAAILAKARAPVYVLTGNKDDRAHLREAFLSRGYLRPDFPFVQYAIDSHPVRLVVLDTQSDGNKGDFCCVRLQDLMKLLDADARKPIAVFTHHPPFLVPEGPEPLHFESAETMAVLARALNHSGRVAEVFSGHVHRAAFGYVGSIPATVMTATATPLRRGHYPNHLRNVPVYHVHRFDPVWGFVTETRLAR